MQYNDPASVVVETFTEELHRLVTNRPITYLRVNAQEDRTALERESRRVVRDEPDLVVAMGGVAANAIYHAGERGTVPAVIGFVDYGKTVELVDATQARGGQMTGVATLGMTLTGEALETLVTTDPAIQRVLFVHSTNPAWVSLVPDLFETTDLLGAELVVSEVVTAEEAARTFDRIQSGDVDAILLSADQTVLDARDAVRALSHRAEIPIITLTSNPVGGAVMSLGSDALDSGVYPGFPTTFWGLLGFFVGDLMGKALWKLVENEQRFPRRGGRVLCVHGAVSFRMARPCATRWLPGEGNPA